MLPPLQPGGTFVGAPLIRAPLPGLETLPWLDGNAWCVAAGPLGAPLEGPRKVECSENMLTELDSASEQLAKEKASRGHGQGTWFPGLTLPLSAM